MDEKNKDEVIKELSDKVASLERTCVALMDEITILRNSSLALSQTIAEDATRNAKMIGDMDRRVSAVEHHINNPFSKR